MSQHFIEKLLHMHTKDMSKNMNSGVFKTTQLEVTQLCITIN